tara:strand:- start:202 stop:375 length:174 start_codon:yes stop_codon:yes gene_type:complete
LNCDKKYSCEGMLGVDNEKLIASEGFSALMSPLSTDCDVFEPDPSLKQEIMRYRKLN